MSQLKSLATPLLIPYKSPHWIQKHRPRLTTRCQTRIFFFCTKTTFSNLSNTALLFRLEYKARYSYSRHTLNFPHHFIPTWSCSKKFAMSTISTWSESFHCYFEAKMMALSHESCGVFCIPTWSMIKWYDMSCDTNYFLIKVWYVS